MHAHRTTVLAILISAATAAAAIGPISPAQARPTHPAAPITTCAKGVPLRGDYNGDGQADPAVQALHTDGNLPSFQIRLTPDGGAWVDGAHTLRPADLNGDTCSDAVVSYGQPTPMVKLFLGSPAGLQDSGTAIVPPQIGTNPYPGYPSDPVNAIALKHDGLVQIVVAGYSAGAFIDVYTLSKDGVPGAPQVIAGEPLKHVRSGAFGTELSGSGRTVVIGSPDESGARHTYQGAAYLLRSSASKPAKLVLRARVTQSSKGIFGSPGQGHHFGSAVAYRSGTVAIGIQGESAGGDKRGVVQLLSWPDSSKKGYRPGGVLRRGGLTNTDGSVWQFGYQITPARGLTAKGSTDLVFTSADGSEGGSVVIVNTRTGKRLALNTDTTYLPRRELYQDGFTATSVVRSSATKDRLLIRVGDDNHPICGPGSTYVTMSSPGVISAKTTWTELPPPDCSAGYSSWGRAFQ